MNANEITTIANKTNGTRRNRIISERDIARFFDLFTQHENSPEVHTIRVYSGQGFVANAYKYRAEIVALEATRDAEKNWRVYGLVVDAKRSHGGGALATVNGRAA